MPWKSFSKGIVVFETTTYSYNEVWEAAVESRWFAKEPKNASNRHAVAVKKELS